MTDKQQIADLRETLHAALADVKATTYENTMLKAHLAKTKAQLAAAKHYIAGLDTDTDTDTAAWHTLRAELNA